MDHFIDAGLNKIALSSAPPATAHEIVYRLHFGLTGLPPSPKLIESFISQFKTTPQTAITDLAQELMTFPRYGEHFGRHWLDVARYADSAGFENDYARPHTWRYRDYVIRDVHCTILHLLGLDDNKLTYYHAGRHKQLSQFGGQIISQLLV
ncbi:DUF1549 domain-containing protein [Akkermansiaceae bacterium]|nr:DUF1549 domain-containing protein [Akkermansiaceae bacterium]